MTFIDLLLKVREQRGTGQPPQRVLALDPGETTGYAFFKGAALVEYGQVDMKVDKVNKVRKMLLEFRPDIVVAENYRVYEWKAKIHSWSSLFTPRLLEAIKTLCELQGIPVKLQMAQTAKGFCTTKKLKEWDFYPVGRPHAADAVRHGCYFLLFGTEKGGSSDD